jgi:iron complex outermembrane recepter protein
MLMLFTPKKIAVAVFLALSVSHVMAEEKKSAADSATPETLDEVEVKSAVDKDALAKPYAGGQVAKGGSLGVLGNQDVMDVPFSTVNYTSELIQNQQARSVADVVVNDASVRALTAPGGFGDQFQIRGYTVGNEDTGLNGLFGLTSTTRVPLEMVERVQVLKGPGTFVNGIPPSGSIGGSVNLVTKRAGNDPLTRLTTSYLGESQFAAHIDAGRRFGQNNEWGVRVNALKRSGEGTIDKGSQQTGLASLGLDYLGEKLRWSLDVIVQGDDIREFRPQASIADNLTRIPSAPDARKNFYPGTKLDYNGKTYMSNLEYDVNSNVTLYGGVGYTDFAFSQTFPSAEGGIGAGGNFTLRNAYYDYYSKTFVSNAGARFKFATGNVGHAVTLSANRLSQENGYFYNFSAGTAASNIHNPVALPSIAGTRNSPTRNLENVLTSYVLTDTLSFLDEKVLLTLGVRDQTVEQRTYDLTTGAKTDTYDKGAVSPLAGIVVKPLDNVALYANHTKGLTQGELVPVGAGFSNGGTALAPYKSTQNEVGVKVDFGRITTVVSVFQIERPNREDDPVTNRRSYSGEQRNRGLELAAYGEISSGLRMMASTTFTDPKVKSNSATSDGKDAIGVPDFTANLGLDWDTPWVDGLSFNGRAIGTSSAYYNSANTVSVPGWTRLDIGARYITKAAGKPIVLRANLENVLDKDYWLQSGTFLTIAAPRTLLLSATIDF